MFKNKYKYHILLCAIVVKLCVSFLLLFAKGYPEIPIKEIACIGDCGLAYLPAAENIVEHGKFTIYENLASYSGRMPGYEFVLIASTIFSRSFDVSFFFLIIFQSIIAGISMYFLAKLSYSIFRNKTLAVLTFVLYGISTYTSLFDIAAITESLSISVFIIAFCLLFDSGFSSSNLAKLIIGILLLFTVLLRQYILPFFLLWIVYIIYTEYQIRKSIKAIFLSLMIFILPLFCFEVYWIVRNYQQKNKFIPLVDSLYAGYDNPVAKDEKFYFPPKMKALADFIKSWGGDFIWWNPKAEITAFVSYPPKSQDEKIKMLNSFPSYIYTSEYSKDSLYRIQKIFGGELNVNESETVKTLKRFEQSFKDEKLGYFYFVSPLKLLYKFLFHSGTYNLFNKSYHQLNFFQKGIKFFYSILYISTLTLGILGIIIVLFKREFSIKRLILVATAIYIILLVSFVLRRIEYRHFAFAYPYFIILSSYFIHFAYQFFRNKLNIKNNLSYSSN